MIKGIIFSLLASLLFGCIYYFSTLLLPLNGEDIFGYRVIFTAPFVISAVFLFKQKYHLIAHFKHIQSQPWFILVFLFNGLMMGFQMWLFLWAPNNNGAISVSLGYLLLPLVMVATGRIFFKENISKLKYFAIVLATIGVATNIILTGGLSWESIAVCGYALYFMIRKYFNIADLAGLAIEMTLILPICIFFATQVDIEKAQHVNQYIVWLLLILGLLSGIAFIFYIAASNLLPINLLGLLGYIEPILMLAVAFMLGEKISLESYPLFICLILAMLLILIDGIIKINKYNAELNSKNK